MSLNQLAINAIKKYQKNKALIGAGRCRHLPTCSNYGIACYEKFNFLKASFLTLWRIIRCNPLTKRTYDPVPLTREEKRVRKALNAKIILIKTVYLNLPKIIQNPQIEDYIVLTYESVAGKKMPISFDNWQELKESFLKKPSNLIRGSFQLTDLTWITASNSLSDEQFQDAFSHLSNDPLDDEQYLLYYERIAYLKKLIKQKKIAFNYPDSCAKIEYYLSSNILCPNHFIKDYYLIISKHLE